MKYKNYPRSVSNFEELERNSRTPVFLDTVKFDTTHKLTLHLQITKKGVIYKQVCLGISPQTQHQR